MRHRSSHMYIHQIVEDSLMTKIRAVKMHANESKIKKENQQIVKPLLHHTSTSNTKNVINYKSGTLRPNCKACLMC